MAQGLFSVLTAVGNFAPIIVGKFTDGSLMNFGGNQQIPLSYDLGAVLTVVVGGSYLVSGILFTLAARLDDSKSSKVQ